MTPIRPLPALNQDHTGQVAQVIDTGKTFSSGGITKKKYIVKFVEGYEAEFCPPELVRPQFQQGDHITFRIAFRNSHGDTIDVISANTSHSPSPSPFRTLSTTSMAGHPATIALQSATQLAVIHGWGPEELKEHAYGLYEWLINLRDSENL